MSTTAGTRGGDSEGCECVNGEVFIVQIVGANETILRMSEMSVIVRQADLVSVPIYVVRGNQATRKI
jgi:hypothetical protein